MAPFDKHVTEQQGVYGEIHGLSVFSLQMYATHTPIYSAVQRSIATNPATIMNTIFSSTGDDRNGIFIITNADGTYVTPFASTPEDGYLQLVQRRNKIVASFSGSRIQQSVRTCLFNGSVKMLEMIVAEWNRLGTIPGQIVSRDILRTDLPAAMLKSKSLERNAKQAGKDGVMLTVKGVQIYQSRFYTEDMTEKDVRIQHDNTDDVAAQQERIKNAAKPAAALTPNAAFDTPATEVESPTVVPEPTVAATETPVAATEPAL